jgi:hypothetical protein
MIHIAPVALPDHKNDFQVDIFALPDPKKEFLSRLYLIARS